jgi:hypothetical protein
VKDKKAALAHEDMIVTGEGKAALIIKKERQERGCGKKKEHAEFLQKTEIWKSNKEKKVVSTGFSRDFCRRLFTSPT